MTKITDPELRDLVKQSYALFHKFQAENAKGFQELREAQARTDTLIQEFKKENAKGFQELRKAQARTDAQLAKTDAQFAKAIEKLQKASEIWGNLGGVEGELAEHKIFDGLRAKMSIGGIKFDSINESVRPSGKQGPEFDIVLYNGDSICIVEVKRKFHEDKLATILKKKISEFRKHFPQFKSYKLYFAIGSLIVYKDLIEKSRELGAFLLTEKNEVVEIVNEKAIAY